MSEHPLHRLHVRPRGHGEARGGMTQIVRGYAGQSDRLGSGLEYPRPEVGVSQRAAVRRGEDQVCRALAGDMRGQLVVSSAGDQAKPSRPALR
jgi:hypothetical protein